METIKMNVQIDLSRLTKKDFKELVYYTCYTGWDGHRIKINAFFLDWKDCDWNDCKKNNKPYWGGYKYMVKANIKDCSKQELFNQFYDWVTEKIQQPDWYIGYKYANTDQERFKISLTA